MSLGQLIKQNPVILAGALISIAIYLSADILSYKYLNIGQNGYLVLKDGQLKKFCDISKDYCYIKNERGDYYPEEIQLNNWLK